MYSACGPMYPSPYGLPLRCLPSGSRCSDFTSRSMYMSTPPIASTIFWKPVKLMIAPASNRSMPVTFCTVLASSSKPCGALGFCPCTTLPCDMAPLSFPLPPP